MKSNLVNRTLYHSIVLCRVYSVINILTPYLLVSNADNLCKQFGPRPGPTKCRAWSGFKLLDTLMIFLKEFFENINFEKNQQNDEKSGKIAEHAKVKLS